MRKVFRARPVHPVRRYAHRSWPVSLQSVLRVCTADPLASHLSLATALSRFHVSTAHTARSVPDAPAKSLRTRQPLRSAAHLAVHRRWWGCIELRPWGLVTPATVCSRSSLAKGGEALRSAREIHPSKLALVRIGTGFPAQALLRFLGGVPCARCGSAAGFCSPDEVPRGLGPDLLELPWVCPSRLSLSPPWLSVHFPGHPPACFSR